MELRVGDRVASSGRLAVVTDVVGPRVRVRWEDGFTDSLELAASLKRAPLWARVLIRWAYG